MLDFSKLDDLLDALPPPPVVRAAVPTATRFLFIGEAKPDPVAVYEDLSHKAVSEQAKQIPSTAWNAGVLIGLNMKLSRKVVQRSPRYIDNNGEEYPKSTSVHCWWCRAGFKTRPIGIPYRHVRGKNAFTCFGNFCSFECSLASSIESQSVQIRMFSGSLLLKMRKATSGIRLSVPLRAAPHWASLKTYGGYLSLAQFRRNNTRVRAIPENLRLYPVGYNLFDEQRKVNRVGAKRTTASIFDEQKKRSKIQKKSKKTNYKTNFSHVKLKLKKKQSSTSKLSYKAPKKSKLKLF